MSKNWRLDLMAVLLCAIYPAPASAFHVGMGNAVASQGANVVNKVVPPPLPSCGGNFQPFTQAPIVDANFIGLTPLGSQNSEHILPPDHMYLNVHNFQDSGQILYAPSNGWVVQVTASYPSAGSGTSYSVVFSPCAEVAISFMGLPTISAALAAAVAAAPSYNNSCVPYSNDNGGIGCTTNLQFPIQAGQILGSGVFVDFGPLQDSRVNLTGFANPARHNLNRGFCPLSYFQGPVSQWATGDYIGGTFVKRSTAPLCGTIVQDIPGTAQGDWYVPNSPESQDASYLDELEQLALVHDSVFASTGAFSTGPNNNFSSQIPGGMTQGKIYFTPKTNANGQFFNDPNRIDVDFSFVTPGSIYCYDGLTLSNPENGSGTPVSGSIILVQLTDANHMNIEGQSPGGGASCLSTLGNWAFANPVPFQR